MLVQYLNCRSRAYTNMYLTEQTIDQRHAEYLTLDDVLLDTIDS